MRADSLEGRNLGRYRVLEPVGRGGMARVYRAYHPQLDRYVAIKVLRSDLVEEEDFLARFQREARAVAGLRHPNIIQVFDFDVQADLYYMVMELLEGDSLRTRLNEYRARGKRMPHGEMVRVLLDVLGGLDYAHSEGMIHRDVKPANILLTRRGQAVLTDFGIAQIVGGTRPTVSGALMGTLSYMAPEQGLEGHCDARSDIYSLGIVYYEMLTGDPPYDADTPLAILMKHVNDPLPLPRKIEPSIPKAFERLVLKALSKRPQDRYQSAHEMAAALAVAAKKANVDVPDHLSLPFSFSTPEAPSESVAVLSGSARNQVLDADFAAEDTDARLGERLAAEAAAQQAAERRAPPIKPPQRPKPPTPSESRYSSAEPLVARGEVLRSILMALVVLITGNLVAVFAGLVTGRWGVYGRGWPFELLLVGLGLCLIMEASASVWMLIPMGIILGNGFIMAFYALTDLWAGWTYLWPLEPILVIGTIWFTLRLARQGDQGRRTARNLARALKTPTVVAIAFVILVGTVVSS